MTGSFLKKINIYLPQTRNLNYNYILDKDMMHKYADNGYAIVRNIVSNETIEMIKNTYNKITKMPAFYEADSFIASPNYGKEIQSFVQKELSLVTEIIIPEIFDINKIDFNILNILVLKFNKTNDSLFPHQDAPMLDEAIAPTTFLWIPISDINNKNGSLLVLPGSHKWANWQRTHNQHESPLKKHRKTILKHMIPVYLNKGDVLLFDSALIHASSPNLSDDIRIAMNTGVIPKGFEMVHYLNDSSTPKGKIKKFKIDIEFWKNANYIDAGNVPKKYHPAILENSICNFYINKLNLMYLLNKFKPAKI